MKMADQGWIFNTIHSFLQNLMNDYQNEISGFYLTPPFFDRNITFVSVFVELLKVKLNLS